MKITVDKDKCIACGMCASTCPQCFEIKDGFSHVKEGVEDHRDCDLDQVAADCPVGAIEISE